MKKQSLLALIMLITFISCKQENVEEKTWKKITQRSKTIDNITYYFPDDVDLKSRNEYIEMCKKAISKNLKFLKEDHFTNKMDIVFVHSRDEIKKLTGLAAQGMACIERDTLYCILRKENSPITHEINHMITFYKWGSKNYEEWLVEGLGTITGGTCSNYTLEEIYQYYLQSNKLVPMNILINDFWKKGNNDIITYTQSALLCQHLIKNYGLTKFKKLWQKGSSSFFTIYGFPITELENRIKKELKLKYPKTIPFNWQEFNKGCH